MSDTLASLSRKIDGAAELKSVVRSMKALAASSIGQYEQAVRALTDYARTVELSLTACLRDHDATIHGYLRSDTRPGRTVTSVSAIVFGSDQGLVGQFNEDLADYVVGALNALPGEKLIWAVGERVESRLVDSGLSPLGRFGLPTSVHAITSLVGEILLAYEGRHHEMVGDGGPRQLHLFYNSIQKSGAREIYASIDQRLLPLDAAWAQKVSHLPWPSKNLPEVIGDSRVALEAFVREHLFVSVFKACAESLAAENASRLAAMQRAEKNIDDLVGGLAQSFRRLRQSSIDEELFDVLAGYESQSGEGGRRH